MGLFDWFKQKDEHFTYQLDGTEVITCGETEEVMRCLEFIGSAASLYPIKGTAAAESDSDLQKRLFAYTDGMTDKQVDDMHEGACNLMTWLTKGASSPLKITGTLQIVHGLIGGVLLSWTINDESHTINFPYGGLKANHGGQTHMRIAEKSDDKLRLQWVVDGAPDVTSVSKLGDQPVERTHGLHVRGVALPANQGLWPRPGQSGHEGSGPDQGTGQP